MILLGTSYKGLADCLDMAFNFLFHLGFSFETKALPINQFPTNIERFKLLSNGSPYSF